MSIICGCLAKEGPDTPFCNSVNEKERSSCFFGTHGMGWRRGMGCGYGTSLTLEDSKQTKARTNTCTDTTRSTLYHPTPTFQVSHQTMGCGASTTVDTGSTYYSDATYHLKDDLDTTTASTHESFYLPGALEDTWSPRESLHWGVTHAELVLFTRVTQLPKDFESKDQEECVLCLEVLQVGDHIRTLQCNHHFHPGCVDAWFTRSRLCPTCCQSIRPGSLTR